MKLKRILLLSIILEIVALASMAYVARKEALDLVKRESELVWTAHNRSMERELKQYVQLARSMIQQLARSDQDVRVLQREALKLLSQMRFGKDGYFFAYDRHGRLLLDPSQMGISGVDFCDPDEPEGQAQARLILAKAKDGGGLVSYDWRKPSSQSQIRKTSYVEPIDEWHWTIGTGIYMDEVSEVQEQIEVLARENIQSTLNKIVLVAAVSIALIGIAGLGMNLRSHHVSSEKLRQLARRVVGSQEEERVRVARELHDGVVQVLVSSKYFFEAALAGQTRPADVAAAPPPRAGLMERGISRLNEALGEIQRVSHGLRPVLLDDLGLLPALRLLVKELREQHDLDVLLVEHGTPSEMSTSKSTALFRVVQEAINNIHAHAHATRVTITLGFSQRHVVLSIRDNGRGFDLKRVQADQRSGIGLRNMRERIESLMGRFSVKSDSGGTLIEASLPLGETH